MYRKEHFIENVNELDSNDGLFTSLRILADDIFTWNKQQGFWPENRNFGEALALVHSEISECLEAHRKQSTDSHLPQYKGVEVELADAMIRILDIAAGYELDVIGALKDKLIYNANRPHKHGKSY